MASTSKKQIKQSPASQRKSRKPSNVNLHAAQNDEITVVGIGASAGGLKALEGFFGALPNDTGLAYVVITHLHPEHESHLAELLQRHTQMPVQQVNGLVHVEKDHVYVIPPNRQLVMEDSQIDVSEFKEPRGQRAPIDYFFRSLARGHPNSVGIILSGGGTDGTVGVKAIKEEGGLLMVQHPDEAEYNSMPQAAIATGLADIVLPVKGLAKKLMEYTRQRPLLPLDAEELDEDRKLNQVRDMFYALFRANPIPTAFTRLEDGVFINVNVEFLTYFGFQHEDIIGHSSQEFNLGLEPQARKDLFTRIKEEGTVRNYEAEIHHPSGETRNILASIQYVNLDNTDALITAFTDITDRVRAEQQVRALASELTAAEQTERHRLAQILHDDLQQRLFAVQMQMTFLKDAYERNDLKAFQVDFPQVEGWLVEAIKVTRQLSVDLSPPILHGEGLVEATIWLASQMEEQYGLAVDIKSRGTPRQLDENVRVLMFYAVRELLFNTVKHAGTLKAAVDFEHGDERLRVHVSDQGKGFDDTEATSNSKITHGLLTIRYRLNLLGCIMNIKSQPGQGTEAIIEAPYGQVDR